MTHNNNTPQGQIGALRALIKEAEQAQKELPRKFDSATDLLIKQISDNIARAQETIADIERRNSFGDDTYKDGSILTWTLQFRGGGSEYTYAAVKVGSFWHMTGSMGQYGQKIERVSWSALTTWLSSDKVVVNERGLRVVTRTAKVNG